MTIYNPRNGKPAILPKELADDPDIKGRPGNPNCWSIPADEHIALHKKNRPEGDYNTRWKQELELLDPDKSKWTKQDILDIRDKLTKEFGTDKYKPKCKKMKIYRLLSSVNGKGEFAVLRPSNTQNIKEVDVLDV